LTLTFQKLIVKFDADAENLTFSEITMNVTNQPTSHDDIISCRW